MEDRLAGEVWRARMNRGKAERGWRRAEGLRAGRGGIVFDWSNCCRSVVHGYDYVMSAMLRAHKRALFRCLVVMMSRCHYQHQNLVGPGVLAG